MNELVLDLDRSSVDREHAAIFLVEFLAWWFIDGRDRYNDDPVVRMFAVDAAATTGWRAARQIARDVAFRRQMLP